MHVSLVFYFFSGASLGWFVGGVFCVKYKEVPSQLQGRVGKVWKNPCFW